MKGVLKIVKVLFVVGSCLRVNSSANLCHIAYIKGCVDLGYEVDVLSMSEKNTIIDESIVLPDVSNWYTFDPPRTNNTATSMSKKKVKNSGLSLDIIKQDIKKIVLKFYGIYGHTASVWMRRARNFKSDKNYDFVISLATPYFSHHLTYALIKGKHILYKKWIQIWEDPWNFDLYNKKSNKRSFREEQKLLSYPDQIIYSSPITLQYQKKAFPQQANKMEWYSLPYYYKNNIRTDTDYTAEKIFGYFGDYYSFSRNLSPFYIAARDANVRTKIFGNSDLNINSTDRIEVQSRVGLKELANVEKETDVLVFLCNIQGGQIPGKLYQYSATEKPIIFILDGTDKEIKILKTHFEQFKRYVFCNNNRKSILSAIRKVELNNFDDINNYSVEAFSPKETMTSILDS